MGTRPLKRPPQTTDGDGASYADWMAQLPESLRHWPLSQIAIPGSHDSGTADLSLLAADDLQPPLRLALRLSCGLLAPAVRFWALSQSLSIADQLAAGVRYLDLRVSVDGGGHFILVHGLQAGRVDDALDAAAAFLGAHLGEVLLLDFNHFYGLGAAPAGHRALARLIRERLGALLRPSSPQRTPDGLPLPPSIAQCAADGRRALVFYHAPSGALPPDEAAAFWPGGAMLSLWHDVHSVAAMLRFVERCWWSGRDPGRCTVTQAVVTPGACLIAGHPLLGLRGLAAESTPAFLDWAADKEAGPRGLNIVIADFAHENGLVPGVLALNQRSAPKNVFEEHCEQDSMGDAAGDEESS